MNSAALRALFAALLAATSVVLAQPGSTGNLKTKVSPGRAGVFVNGKYLGPAANFGRARTYALPAGEHEVKLAEPRYEEMTVKVTIAAGQTATINQTLKPLPKPQPPFGRIRTQNADKFAAVYINGKFMGHVDEFSNGSQGLLLPPGEYDLKIVPVAGGSGTEQKVKVEADKTIVVGSN
jgi:hypothetical protein